jgi:hypothetical protein
MIGDRHKRVLAGAACARERTRPDGPFRDALPIAGREIRKHYLVNNSVA